MEEKGRWVGLRTKGFLEEVKGAQPQDQWDVDRTVELMKKQEAGDESEQGREH